MTDTSGGRTDRRGDDVAGRRDSVRAVSARRRAVLGTTATGIAASLGGCIDVLGSGGGGSDPIRVGVLAQDPDRDAVGRSIAQAAELWAQDRDLLGREVEVVVQDTKASPLEGRRAYQRLVLDADVDVTTGIFETRTLDSVVHEIAEHRRLHFTTGSTSMTPTRLLEDEPAYRYHFRVMLNETQIAESQHAFLRDVAGDFGWETVAPLVENYPWAEGLANLYRSGFQGVETTDAIQYPPQTDAFEDYYQQVEEGDADVAWVGMAHTGDDAILDWAAEQPRFAFAGIHVPMQLPAYWEMTDGACQYGITQTTTTATTATALGGAGETFVADYEDEFGELPVYTGYNTYNAMMTYEAAVEEAGSVDSTAVRDALYDVEVESLTGTISFDDPTADDARRYPHDLPVNMDNMTDQDTPGAMFFQWQEDDNGEGVQEVVWPDYAVGDDVEYVEPHWF